MTRTSRFFLYLIGAAVALVAVLLVAPQFIPVEVYKKQLIERAEAATGRSIAVNGDVGLRFLPNLQLTLNDVHVSNPKDFGAKADKDMLALKELQLSVGLFDLLSGKVTVKKFELIDPIIALEKNAKGKANWEFPAEEKSAKPEAAKSEGQSFISQFQLPALTISNGTFSYAAPGAETVSLSKLNLQIEAPGLASAANIALDTTYGKDVPLKATVKLDSPQVWLDGKDAKVALAATLGNTTIDYTGTARQDADGKIFAKGTTKANSASLKALGKQLGTVILPDSLQGEGKLSFAGNVDYADLKVSVSDIALALDSLHLNGTVSADLGGKKPSVTANLESPGVLVVGDLLAPAAAPAEGEAKAPAAAQSGWSDEPVLGDTSFLTAANADVTLKLGGLKYDTITAGALSLHALLKNGALSLTLPDFDFYEGKANFALTLSAPSKSANISQKVALTDINVGKFLQEVNGFDKLAGKGNITLSTTTNGASVADFVNRLSGNGSLKMRDGAIKGINLAETVRNAKNLLAGGTPPQDASSGVQTDFSELAATFTITQGIVSNNDLSLKAPLLTLTGDGTVNLPQKRVDYRLRPSLVANLQGQGREAEASKGITIPLRVTGTFDKLSFTPDAKSVIEDVLKDPSAAKETLKENIKGAKSLFDSFKKK